MELEKITKIVETISEIADTEEEVFVEETDIEDEEGNKYLLLSNKHVMAKKG